MAEKQGRGAGASKGRSQDYVEAKRLASHKDPAVRRRLASRTDVEPEILYFLAEDDDQDVRREAAANPAMPRQADLLLVDDVDDDVRLELARKIGRLAPELN
jgi:hypothetical protein